MSEAGERRVWCVRYDAYGDTWNVACFTSEAAALAYVKAHGAREHQINEMRLVETGAELER